MKPDHVAPIWQRIFCGVLCVGSMAAVPLNAVHGAHRGWHEIVAVVVAVYGAYLFGHIALRGRLPGKDPGTEYVHFRRGPDRRHT